MIRLFICCFALGWSWLAPAAELSFDFSKLGTNGLPQGFRSAVTGEGAPGEWKVLMDEVPPQMQALTPAAQVPVKRPVLAQTAQERTEEHFPLLIYGDEVFADFTFTTRFKIVAGVVEQMAGVAFRIQDEKNYYIVRASALGNTFRFYKFVSGQRTDPIGPEIKIPANVWQQLSVECKGNQIRCLLNGKEALPTLTDNTFTSGRIGFWTKSDAVSYFTDANVVYTPREPLAQAVLRDAVARNPRLVGLQMYASPNGQPLKIIASKDPAEVGELGGVVEQDILTKGTVYFGRTKTTMSVTLPLRDRNGDVVAAVRVILTPFPGQTEQTTIARALPILKYMEERLRSSKDLVE